MVSILADKNKFIELSSRSSSMSEMLRLAGLREAGGNFGQLHKWSKKHSIPLPKGASDLTAAHRATTKWTVENSFTKDSKARRGSVKRLIIAHRLIPYECATDGCGLTDSWLGKPIVLHLEHKNGVFNDNRLENLEFLCPNCHSQTSTYAGRKTNNVLQKELDKA